MLHGQRALVLGVAREGTDLLRFLARAGARVVASDQRPADSLGEEARAASALPGVELRAGSAPDPDWLASLDVVFASPGVPIEHPFLVEAHARGVRVTSLIELFFELCPAPIVGITGSAGKTTTTSLTGDVFRAAGREVFVGGNIGWPLLGELERIQPSSWVVLELSSFQLEPMRRSPHIAVVTNVTPNHLDRHRTMEVYWAAKGQILNHQEPDDWAILNADDPWSARYEAVGRTRRFSLEHPVQGAFQAGDLLVVEGETLVRAHEVPVPGRHNLANVLASALACRAAGIPLDAIRSAVTAFHGVPHRLQVVAERHGVRFVDDSIATAPERSMAALHALQEPVVLIAGGRDKHLPMEDWARLIQRRARHVVLLGEMSGLIAEALQHVAPEFNAVSCAESMEEAVQQAAEAARPGDVVLLSPGGTSFDRYRDFEERGDHFSTVVRGLDPTDPPHGSTREER